MSEFRQNFATKEWVIVAPNRNARPKDVGADSALAAAASGPCPFCPGNEHETGEELLRCGDQDAWTLRVVRNKFSALAITRSPHRIAHGKFLKSESYGAAEVIIESPLHNQRLHEMSVEHIELILRAFRTRAAAAAHAADMAIVMIFRNYGPNAGTSLAHPHSQLIASPIVPPHIRDPFQKAALHYDTFGSCVYCDMVHEELRQAERIIEVNEHVAAFCPFASRTPYELRLYPLRHCASIVWSTDQELRSFAAILRGCLRRTAILLGDPSYNFIIRSAPIGDEDVRYLHWYFILIPKISTPAGFEIGSGMYINSVSPETCADALRRTDP